MAVTVTYTTLDHSGDFQTTTFEPGDQLLPDVLGLSGGGFVSAYVNDSATDDYVALSFYAADESPVGAYQLPYQGFTAASGQPKLAELADGNVLVVWDEDDTSEDDAGPHASIFTPEATLVAWDIDLFEADNVLYGDIDVAALDNGGFVVSYTVLGDVFFRRFDSAGLQQGGLTQVSTAAGVQADTQVAVLSDGAIAVVWTDTEPADQLIKARIYESDGTPRTGEFTASPGIGDNTRPSIAALRDGGFAVVYDDTGWNELGTTGAAGISMNLVSSAGVVSTVKHVNVASAADETDADVTVLENGFITVSWTVSMEVVFRVFDTLGNAVTNQTALGFGPPDQRESSLSSLGRGGYFIGSWRDSTSDGSGGQIASQISELTRTVNGDTAANSYTGDELRDTLNGGGGDDTLDGAGNDDTIDAGAQNDVVVGGAGNDVLQGGDHLDAIYGGFGNDRIWSMTRADPHGSTVGDLILGEGGVDRVRGSAGRDTVLGGIGGDKLTGGGEVDSLYGQEGADKIKGSGGNDVIEGGAHADNLNGGIHDDFIYAMSALDLDGSGDGDRLNGAQGDDDLFGSAGGDKLFGTTGRDALQGRGGGDTLNGGIDKDTLNGGAGADVLVGGEEKDIFVFVLLSDSANGAEDLISDLKHVDVIALSGIDAKATNGGDQAFTLVDAFSGEEGELVVDYHTTGPYAGFTTVQGDVDGDGLADLVIKIDGDKHNFASFVL